MDYGHATTDKRLKKLEKALTAQYGVANKELTKKMREYFEKFEKQDAEKLKLLNANKITEKEYLQWRANKMLTGERWREVRDTVASDLTNVNKISAKMITNEMVDAYALNANYGMFEIEKGANVNLSFSLYSHDTVERMIKDKKFPVPKVDVPKDQRWNRQKINSVMLQGVLQGQSIPKLANGLQKVTDMNRSSAIRNARTYITGAENRGRIDSYKRAEDYGIEMEKVWMATLDGRTRDSHRKLDGEAVKVNEEFSNGCMYPGDPDCPDDSEIYNCRCTLVAELSKYKNNWSDNIASRRHEMTKEEYDEWKAGKERKEERSGAIYNDYYSGMTYHDIIDGMTSNQQKNEFNSLVEHEKFEYNKSNNLEKKYSASEYFELVRNGEIKNENIEAYLLELKNKEQTAGINQVKVSEKKEIVKDVKKELTKAEKKEGIELYRTFIEGGSAEIHELAGVSMNGTYVKENVNEEKMRLLDSVFTPAKEEKHVYKGLKLSR